MGAGITVWPDHYFKVGVDCHKKSPQTEKKPQTRNHKIHIYIYINAN